MLLPFYVHFVLRALSGDVHPNPGPDNRTEDMKNCHANVRSLLCDTLTYIKTSLAQSFDIITLPETFLTADKDSRDLNLPGFHPIMRRDSVHGLVEELQFMFLML